MNLTTLLDEFLCECEYKNLSAATIRNYSRILNEFINAINITDIGQLDRHIIKDYINSLPLAVSSKNQYLRCISAFWHWYENEYDTDLRIKVKRLKEKRAIKYTPTDEEVDKLINYYNNKSYLGARNKTMISVLVNLGVRGNELLGLKKDDIDFRNNIITVRNRKGNIDQQLPLNKEVKLQLVKYMNRYDNNSDLLFVTRNGYRMSLRDIGYIIKKCNSRLTAHSLRRYCCTTMLKQGIPLIMVSRFMNHSSIEVTNSYYADIKATDIDW